MLNGKAMIVLGAVGLIKKTQYKLVNILQHQNLGGRVRLELDLPSYATKSGFKNSTVLDTSKFAKRV